MFLSLSTKAITELSQLSGPQLFAPSRIRTLELPVFFGKGRIMHTQEVGKGYHANFKAR